MATEVDDTATTATVADDDRARGRRTDHTVPWLDRPVWHVLRLDPIGLGLGVALAMISYTPSLIPRTALFQGLASGISAAIGYGIGVAITWVVLRTERYDHASERYRRVAPPWAIRFGWPVLMVASTAAVLIMVLAGWRWQREIAVLVGTAPPGPGWLRSALIMVVVFAALLAVARGVRLLATIVARLLRRRGHLPRALAALVGTLLVLILLVVAVDQLVRRGALPLVDTAFAGLNDEPYPDDRPPSAPTRSGSPSSLSPWSTLGREGQAFVSGGRPPEQLAVASGRAPRDPVRAYVGLGAAGDPPARARLAVAELERTGGFSRAVLAVATTTGTGWLDGPSTEALELAYGGDTAIVATQYSYLPSWLSFLVDRSRAEAEGRALFDAVRARVDALPPERRPRLLAYGESLGSLGSEAAFSSLDDVRARTDGALWVGPPNANRLWSSLVARRRPGTPEVTPIVDDGRAVRFGAGAADLARGSAVWDRPRVVYLQHPSDPIVWWSPRLLWSRPDWLTEPRGRDVLGAMSWYPIVTFWQVTIDMTNALSVPDGHGHNYRAEALQGWLAVAAPAGWTDADTTRARGILGG